MTLQQILLFALMYSVLLIVVTILTRATMRRVAGALAGAALAAVAIIPLIAIGERAGWWHFVMSWDPYYLTVLCLATIPCGFVFLLTWRIARRFGGRGLAVVALIVTVLGPVRDYRYMAIFPEWGSYGPGIAPALAISASYLILGVLGHALMRLVAGPAKADPLARWPWERVRSSPV